MRQRTYIHQRHLTPSLLELKGPRRAENATTNDQNLLVPTHAIRAFPLTTSPSASRYRSTLLRSWKGLALSNPLSRSL